MATQRGKRAPAPSMAAAPPSPLPPAAHSATIDIGSAANNNNADGGSPSKLSKSNISNIAVATVHRRRCGTGPFDETWLNLDCCGLFCAAVTYGLHLYGCYAVVYILLPPWMSHIYDPDGAIISPTAPHVDGAVRRLSFWGWLHGLAFCCVAGMAIYSHYKAMTTDPGAVPPDAAPLPHPDDIVNGDEMAGLLESGRGGGGTSIGRTTGSAAADSVLAVNNKSVSATAAGAGVASTAAAAVVGGAVAVAAAPALMAGAAVAASLPNSNGNPEQTMAHVPPTIKKPPAPRGKRICRRCNAYKPRRAHHCSVCKRCIIKMDHHCPWVNNCVGIGNHKYFLLFVFYTFLTCTYSMTLVVSRFVGCLGHGRLARGHCLDEPGHILNLVGLIVEAILFGLFTCCMMVDQWDVVMTNVTHIDRLKGDTGFGFLDDASRRLGINEVFGSGSRASAAAAQAAHFRPDWLSPFVRVCFPSSMHDEIMGFCRPCGGMSRAERAKKEDDDHDFELRAGKSPAQV